MPMRDNIVFGEELKQLAIADIVLIIAFTLTLSGGVFSLLGGKGNFSSVQLPTVVEVVAIAVTLSFVCHELMHKFVAQRYGAIAGFKTSMMGLAITLVTGAFGVLLGIPGATMIYVQSFTKRENGIVSLAGPLTNFVVFIAFFAIGTYFHPANGTFLQALVSFTVFISLLLAFFNMLPIPPLDGSKVWAWSKGIYSAVMLALIALIYVFNILSIYNIVFLLIIAFVLSTFYRNVF